MYKCDICPEYSQPGEPLNTYPIMREVPRQEKEVFDSFLLRRVYVVTPARQEIARELKLCKTCHLLAAAGVPLAAIKRQRGIKQLASFPTR